MKYKLLPLWGGLLLFMAVSAKASNQTKTAVFRDFSTSTAPICVSISTSQWTAFPPITTANMQFRDGVTFLIQSTATADMLGLWDKDTNKNTTPLTPWADFRVFHNAAAGTVSISADWRIWLKSLHTASDTVCGREFVQQ